MMELLLKRGLNINYCRSIFTSSTILSNLSVLRKKTGYPLASCKSALNKFNDDVELVRIRKEFIKCKLYFIYNS